ncbi:MAG: nucleotidyltransferase family protein, partial [Ruminiclostridium sp.]
MKVLGIVVEYNPFHNGHIYHIEQSKAVSGCDAVVCIMSGNFIQRGEPALINKFARTEIALQNGVDLVIELPLPFAMSSAEAFGFGAVKILDSIGIVDCISFGSEQGDIASLQSISDILAYEPQEYKDELKKQLSLGLSFPVCRQNAIKKFLENHHTEYSTPHLTTI